MWLKIDIAFYNFNIALFKDLPNNMIHQVAIKTLPQEWLWCETWCDDNSKKYAKTIDLVSCLNSYDIAIVQYLITL